MIVISRPRLVQLLVAIICSMAPAVPQPRGSSAKPAEFQNQQGHYSAEVPRMWHHYDDGAVCLLTNYIPAESVGDDTLPTGGASIRIVPISAFNGELSPSQWLEGIERTCVHGSTKTTRDESLASPFLMDVIRLACDVSFPGGQSQKRIVYQFKRDERVFSVLLAYAKNSSRGRDFEIVQRQIVQTLRARP